MAGRFEVKTVDASTVKDAGVLEGHGVGRRLTPLALRGARSGADDFGRAIKAAVEAS
jgi:hypothetical protein